MQTEHNEWVSFTTLTVLPQALLIICLWSCTLYASFFGLCKTCIRRRQWHPTQYSCLENPMDGGAWWAAVHGVTKSRTRLSNFTFTFHFHALEKEMATHSSVLAWRIQGTGEAGGLPSLGSQRVGHNWSDLAAAAARHVSEEWHGPLGILNKNIYLTVVHLKLIHILEQMQACTVWERQAFLEKYKYNQMVI